MLYSLSANLLENSFAEEDLGVLVEQLGQQCAPAAEVANSTPGYRGTGGPFPSALHCAGTAGSSAGLLLQRQGHVGESPTS